MPAAPPASRESAGQAIASGAVKETSVARPPPEFGPVGDVEVEDRDGAGGEVVRRGRRAGRRAVQQRRGEFVDRRVVADEDQRVGRSPAAAAPARRGRRHRPNRSAPRSATGTSPSPVRARSQVSRVRAEGDTRAAAGRNPSRGRRVATRSVCARPVGESSRSRSVFGLGDGLGVAQEDEAFHAAMVPRAGAASRTRSSTRSPPPQRSRESVPATWIVSPAEARRRRPSGLSADRNATARRTAPSPPLSCRAHVAVPDHPDVRDPQAAEGEDGFGLARPEGAGGLERLHDVDARAARRRARRRGRAEPARARREMAGEGRRDRRREARRARRPRPSRRPPWRARRPSPRAPPRPPPARRGRDRRPGTERPDPVSAAVRPRARRRRRGGRSAPSRATATRPTMPGCQSGEDRTMTGASGSRSSSRPASASASSTACASIARRSSFSALERRGERRGRRRDRRLVRSRAPSEASPMRPPALMRGPRQKPRCQAFGRGLDAGGIG